jgi:dephospho-CoA kinase
MIIGLTGGIGSGKTTVAKLFETMDCAIYNSDEKAKELYFNASVKAQVISLLGNASYLSEYEINKDYISKKVFSDTQLLHQLNRIIHPAVKEDFIKFQSNYSPETLIIKETALLFETGIYKELDYSILVTAPVFVKIERVIKRSNATKEDVEKRMLTQWTDERKLPLANFIIVNDNNQALIPQVLQIIKKLKQHA